MTNSEPTSHRFVLRPMLAMLFRALALICAWSASAHDDHGDTPEAATLLAIGAPMVGKIDGADDMDYYRIDLPGNARVTFRTSGRTDTFGTLLDPSGSVLATNDNTSARGINFRLTRSLARGPYYIAVSASPGSGATGLYSVTALLADAGDHGDTPASSTPLTIHGVEQVARVEEAGYTTALLATLSRIDTASDADYFRIDVPLDATDVTVRSAGGTDTAGRLLDDSLAEVASDDGGTGNFHINRTLDTGIYYVEVTGGVGPYRVVASSSDPECSCPAAFRVVSNEFGFSSFPTEHGDTAETSTRLRVDETLFGYINSESDIDVFRIDLFGSAEVSFSTYGYNADTRSVLRDAAGNALVQDDIRDENYADFLLTARLASGVYYLEVAGTLPPALSSASYRVRASLRDVSDHGDTAAQSTLLPFNSAEVVKFTAGNSVFSSQWEGGDISAVDTDVFRLDIPKDMTDVRIVGHSDEKSSFARLLDTSLTELATSEEGHREGFQFEMPLDAGIYYVEVGSHETDEDTYAIYAADASEAPCFCDDHADSRERATSVPTFPWSVDAEIERSADADFFRMGVDGHGTVTVRVGGAADIEARLTVSAASGDATVLQTGPDAEPEHTIVAGVTPGWYYVEVFGAGGATGRYTLSVDFTPPQASFAQGVAVVEDDGHSGLVGAVDLDGDGDVDLLSASSEDSKVAWHENHGNGSFSGERVITTGAEGVRSVHAADLDGDGDADVLSASLGDGKIAWHENLGGASFSEQRVIARVVDRAWLVQAADLDGDGDADALSYSSSASPPFLGKAAWYENLGDGSFSEPRDIARPRAVRQLHAADLDGDGDADVLAGSSSNHYTFAWYENLGGGNFEERVVGATDWDVYVSDAADLDGDGDVDLLFAAYHGTGWFENTGSGRFVGESLSLHRWTGPSHAADMDGDGDADVVSGLSYYYQDENTDEAYFGSAVAWYENLGTGNFSQQRNIADDIVDRDDPRPFSRDSVYAIDIDGDGDRDILSSRLVWYENHSDHGDDHGDEPASATLVTAYPAFLHGRFESPGDHDVFRFATAAGTLRASSNGPTDTTGRLVDAEGQQVATDDDSGSDLNFALDAKITGGVHYLEVRGDSSTTGPYTLSIEFVAD